jgi:hypothetical protein
MCSYLTEIGAETMLVLGRIYLGRIVGVAKERSTELANER